ncbi:hypothetical protein ANO11243_011350 [Dothideomycetidae sp. 11243]|nr:hypothetical protein ANO11243_011350 [fungal sp. No.11243]
MSRTVVSRHYARIASQWPKDILRPEVQFQTLLNARINSAPAIEAEREDLLSKVLGTSRQPRSSELQEVNALQSLLEDRYSKAVSQIVCLSALRESCSWDVDPVARVYDEATI